MPITFVIISDAKVGEQLLSSEFSEIVFKYLQKISLATYFLSFSYSIFINLSSAVVKVEGAKKSVEVLRIVSTIESEAAQVYG